MRMPSCWASGPGQHNTVNHETVNSNLFLCFKLSEWSLGTEPGPGTKNNHQNKIGRKFAAAVTPDIGSWILLAWSNHEYYHNHSRTTEPIEVLPSVNLPSRNFLTQIHFKLSRYQYVAYDRQWRDWKNTLFSAFALVKRKSGKQSYTNDKNFPATQRVCRWQIKCMLFLPSRCTMGPHKVNC